jgi:endonuclease/exonuclease/phosphatase family metal-dependent hydrolase
VRLLSYNVHYFSSDSKGIWSVKKTLKEISVALSQLNPLPDIVCFQEIEFKSLRAFRTVSQEKAQIDTFTDEWSAVFLNQGMPFPYEGYYFPAHAYRLKNLVFYTTGLAIFIRSSSFRILNETIEPFILTRNEPFKQLKQKLKQTRICAHLALEEVGTNKRLHIYNTHFSLPSPLTKNYWVSRQKMGFGQNQILEARRLLNYIKKTKGKAPVIVCGDFNSWPKSPVYEMLIARGQLTDVRVLLGEEKENFVTAGFMNMKLHLDHVFSSGDIRWKDMENTCRFGDATSPFHGLSDHIPLIAQFEL